MGRLPADTGPSVVTSDIAARPAARGRNVVEIACVPNHLLDDPRNLAPAEPDVFERTIVQHPEILIRLSALSAAFHGPPQGGASSNRPAFSEACTGQRNAAR